MTEWHAREHLEHVSSQMRAESRHELFAIEARAASRHAEDEQQLAMLRASEGQASRISRMEVVSARARANTDREVFQSRCRHTENVAIDNARMHASHQSDKLMIEWREEQGRLQVALSHLANEEVQAAELKETAMSMQSQVDDFVSGFTEASQHTMEIEVQCLANAEAVAEHEESVVAQFRLEAWWKLQGRQARSAAVSREAPASSGGAKPSDEATSALVSALTAPVGDVGDVPEPCERCSNCNIMMFVPQRHVADAAAPMPVPLPPSLYALRTKHSTEPFTVTSLASGAKVGQQQQQPQPQQTHATRANGPTEYWRLDADDSSEESVGEEMERRRTVVKPIDMGKDPTGPGFQNWLVYFYTESCAASNISRRRTMRYLKAVEAAKSYTEPEQVSRKWERFDAELSAACFRRANGETLRKLKIYGNALQIMVATSLGERRCGSSCRNTRWKLAPCSRSDGPD